MRTEPTIIILHESVLASWLKDAGSLGTLAGFGWFNHAHLSGSWPLDLFAVICALIFLISRSVAAGKTALRMTPAELEEWALARKHGAPAV